MSAAAEITALASRRRWEVLLVGALLALLSLPLAALVYRSLLIEPINYNEGWNAYYASLLIHGGPLYYPQQALLSNNYPPLSFLIIASLSAFFGDSLFVGRAIAWLAFAVITAAIAAILRRIDGDRLPALFGAGMFASYMVVNYDIYVGMDDPQMLAHALLLLGLYVYLRHRPAAWAGVVAALLMCAGLFTKHNVIGLPLALTVWLAVYDRAACLRFIAIGLLSVSAGLTGSTVVFGPDFLIDLTASRPYFAVRAWRHALEWTFPMQGPLALAMFASAPGVRDGYSVLFTFYAIVSLLLGCVAAGGDGTNFNLVFDVVIGAALAAGHLVARLETRAPRLRFWVMAAYGASCCLTAALVAKKEALLIQPWIDHQRRLEAETREEVKIVARQPGPALCESLAVCYWAGKDLELDPLNFAFGVAAGTKDLDAVLRRISGGYYAVIVINPPESVNHFLPAKLVDTVRAHYRLAATPHSELYVRP